MIFKMFNTNVPKLAFVLMAISMDCRAQQEKETYFPIQPLFDPRISEFVWFEDSTTHQELDNLGSSNTINIPPFILPGSVDTLADPKKDRDRVPKVGKIDLRL